MIEQSLCHHLHAQLTEYYKLIAILESQMSFRGTHDHSESSYMQDKTGDPQEILGETVLTLRRLDVWINEWRLRMRMMSVCVEGARGMLSSPLCLRVSYKRVQTPKAEHW